MDAEIFFGETRGIVTNLASRQLRDLDSMKVQTTAWIRFKVEVVDEDGNIIRIDMVDKAFNSQMTEVFQGSNLDEVIDEMFAHMKTQIENPALAKSRFKFYRVLFLNISFHKLKLTRGSSYLRLPDWIASRKAIIKPQDVKDDECFKWAVIAALHQQEIGNNPQRISSLRGFEASYHWSGFEFPVAIDKIDIFE